MEPMYIRIVVQKAIKLNLTIGRQKETTIRTPAKRDQSPINRGKMKLHFLAVILIFFGSKSWANTVWSLVKPPSLKGTKIDSNEHSFDHKGIKCVVTSTSLFKTGKDDSITVEKRFLICSEKKSKIAFSVVVTCPTTLPGVADSAIILINKENDSERDLAGIACVRNDD